MNQPTPEHKQTAFPVWRLTREDIADALRDADDIEPDWPHELPDAQMEMLANEMADYLEPDIDQFYVALRAAVKGCSLPEERRFLCHVWSGNYDEFTTDYEEARQLFEERVKQVADDDMDVHLHVEEYDSEEDLENDSMASEHCIMKYPAYEPHTPTNPNPEPSAQKDTP